MLGLIRYLPIGDCDTFLFEIPLNFVTAKGISSSLRFMVDFRQIGIDSINRIREVHETIELWMVFITFCLSFQHMFREKSLSPECDKTLGIKMLGMKRPDAHIYLISDAKIGSSFFTRALS